MLSMSDRRFISRRGLGKVAIGAALAFGGIGGQDTEPHGHLPDDEDGYHNFINEQALLCLAQCGDAKIPYSLAFDTNSTPYQLVVPGIARDNRIGKYDGNHPIYLPGLASGELIPPITKAERPKWEQGVLLNPVFKGPSDRLLVALTIDDGYFNRNEILATIIAEDISATFLIVGLVMDSDVNFIKKAQDSGKITWGNHTYTHGGLTQKSAVGIQDELGRAEASLKKITGATTIPFMRPPGGAKTSSSIAAAANSGFRTFLWNVSGDAGTQWTSDNPQALADYYMGLLDRQGNPWGSIILLHFRPATSAALPLMIREIRRRGMEPVSLDKLYEDGRV